jgi:hypothetical protein
MQKFEVHEVDTKKERKSRLIKRLLVGSAVAVLVGGAAASWWYFTPPAMPTDLASAKQVLESPRFKRLSKAEKQPYFDVIREQFGSLDPEQRRELMRTDGMRDMWRGEMENRLRAFALADEAARQKMIEEGMAMMRGMDNRPREPRPEGERPPRDPSAMRDRMSDRLANGNPQNQAIMSEIMKRIREQRDREQPR